MKIRIPLTSLFRETPDKGENDEPEKEKLSQREVTDEGNDFDEEAPDYHDFYPGVKIDDLSDSKHSFNSSGIDTLVFLHMQKTGGTTLGRRLVDNIGKIKIHVQNIHNVFQNITAVKKFHERSVKDVQGQWFIIQIEILFNLNYLEHGYLVGIPPDGCAVCMLIGQS